MNNLTLKNASYVGGKVQIVAGTEYCTFYFIGAS